LSGRHAAPRHKARGSIVRTARRVTGAVPVSKATATAAVLGVTGVAAVSVGAVAVSGANGAGDAALGAEAASQGPVTHAAVVAALEARAEASRHDSIATVSRSAPRPVLASVQRAVKSRAMPPAKQDVSGAVTEKVEPTEPRDIAKGMLKNYGWSGDQFSCLDEIYLHESNWDPSAENPSSGAFGIPQALPGDKMAAFGADWQTNPVTQLQWGLAYIKDRYGSPCGAWSFWQSNNYY
jgi:hypothetical protein